MAINLFPSQEAVFTEARLAGVFSLLFSGDGAGTKQGNFCYRSHCSSPEQGALGIRCGLCLARNLAFTSTTPSGHSLLSLASWQSGPWSRWVLC